jgi:DNA invertase Pin-like site-specific DNA recombinase
MPRDVVGYTRVAPRERPGERPSLDEQAALIAEAAAARGWSVVGVVREVRTGRSMRRPGLREALDRCRRGEADGIVVSELDRLTYSAGDLAQIVRDAALDGYAVVALADGLDTGSEEGRLVSDVLSTVATWVPLGVGPQARRARAARRSGRPSSTPPEIAERIRAMRSEGMTLQAICDTLDAEGVPTPRGGQRWRPTSLRAILRTDEVTSA